MVTKGSNEATVKLNIRMPADLHKRLKAKAGREDRSLNAQAIQIFREALPNGHKRRATDKAGSK